MSIQADKLKLIQLLLNTESHSIIGNIKAIFRSSEGKDFWDYLTTEQQVEINGAILEKAKNEVVDYDLFLEQNSQ